MKKTKTMQLREYFQKKKSRLLKITHVTYRGKNEVYAKEVKIFDKIKIHQMFF